MNNSDSLKRNGRNKFKAVCSCIHRFFESYKAHNIDFHCVSTGNEPLNGVVPFKYFNSLGWRPDTLHEWIRDHFGPTIRNSTFKDIKIMAHDDQRILLPWMLKLVSGGYWQNRYWQNRYWQNRYWQKEKILGILLLPLRLCFWSH